MREGIETREAVIFGKSGEKALGENGKGLKLVAADRESQNGKIDGGGMKAFDTSLGKLSVPVCIQELQIQHFYKADPAYGSGVAKGLGLDINAVMNKKVASAAD